MSKNLLLAGLVFATGCVVVTYDARNSASDQFTISGSQPLSYQLKVVSVYKDQIPELKNEYSQIVNKVLERHHVPIKQVESMEDAEEQHLEIRVYIKRNETSGQELLSAMTLGVIPVRSTFDTQYEYVMQLYGNRKLKTTTMVALDEKRYFGLIVLPFFWVNFFTLPRTKDSFESAIESMFQRPRS